MSRESEDRCKRTNRKSGCSGFVGVVFGCGCERRCKRLTVELSCLYSVLCRMFLLGRTRERLGKVCLCGNCWYLLEKMMEMVAESYVGLRSGMSFLLARIVASNPEIC